MYVIISGGIGDGKIDIFNDHKIEIIVGASGSEKDAVDRYLRGELKSNGSVRHEHVHTDECGIY